MKLNSINTNHNNTNINFKKVIIFSIPTRNINYFYPEYTAAFDLDSLFKNRLNHIGGMYKKFGINFISDSLGLTKKQPAVSFLERPMYHEIETCLTNIRAEAKNAWNENRTSWGSNSIEWLESHLSLLCNKDIALSKKRIPFYESFLVLTQEHKNAYLKTKTPLAKIKTNRQIDSEIGEIKKKHPGVIDKNRLKLIKLLLKQSKEEENIRNILGNDAIEHYKIEELSDMPRIIDQKNLF